MRSAGIFFHIVVNFLLWSSGLLMQAVQQPVTTSQQAFDFWFVAKITAPSAFIFDNPKAWMVVVKPFPKHISTWIYTWTYKGGHFIEHKIIFLFTNYHKFLKKYSIFKWFSEQNLTYICMQHTCEARSHISIPYCIAWCYYKAKKKITCIHATSKGIFL